MNKRTNKQTNKHFLDPIYLSQIKLDLQKIFRETSCRSPTMIKTKKNKQIYKQTNKQTFSDPKYLSQIKSDLHENFREISSGSLND